MDRVQIVVGLIIVFLLAVIVNMVRKNKIDLRYALGWIILGVIVLVLDIFPDILAVISKLLGITVPSNMIFLVGFLLSFIMIYLLTVSVSKLSGNVKRLTQEMALLKDSMEKNEK